MTMIARGSLRACILEALYGHDSTNHTTAVIARSDHDTTYAAFADLMALEAHNHRALTRYQVVIHCSRREMTTIRKPFQLDLIPDTPTNAT